MDTLTVWLINNQELEFDITEAEASERYETAIGNLRKDIPKAVRHSQYHTGSTGGMIDAVWYSG